MQAPKVSVTRRQITAVLLNLLAMGFVVCALPLLGEGVENLLQGRLLWPLECFAMALVPGSIAYGLWRRRRWVRATALWVSVLAIPLLPLLTFAMAIFSYSAGFTTIVLALFLGLFAALIVYFLTSPETKALFGVSSENASRRRPMISRAVLGTVLLAALVIVGGVTAVSIVSEAVRHRRQAVVNERIKERINERVVGELKPLMEAELRSMGPEGFVNYHCGAFQSLDQIRLTLQQFPTGASRNTLNGIAHFEKVDLEVSLDITFAKTPGEQANVDLRFWPDQNWLKDHPEPNVRIVDRQLEVSAEFGRVVNTTGYARVEGSATCPAFLLSN